MKEIKLRRYQNLLTVSGLGIIAFGLWSVLKTILIFFFNKEELGDLPEETWLRVTLFVIVAAIMLIIFLIHLFIGLSARAEGFGKKKGYAYIVVDVLLIIVSLASIVYMFIEANNTSILELTVSLIVEATSLIVMIELLVAALTVKRLRKELGEVQ